VAKGPVVAVRPGFCRRGPERALSAGPIAHTLKSACLHEDQVVSRKISGAKRYRKNKPAGDRLNSNSLWRKSKVEKRRGLQKAHF
jgi:hypothetical protein